MVSGAQCSVQKKDTPFPEKAGDQNGSVQDRLLEYTWRSKAEYAIVPLSDILGMGKEARLNTPGTVGSPNWEWRMPDRDRIEAGLKKYAGHLSSINL